MNNRHLVALVVAIVLVALTLASCQGSTVAAPADTGRVAAEVGQVPAQTRSVALTTTACGHASATSGSGIVVGDGLVLTAAHVVVGASNIRIADHLGRVEATAVVLRLDTTRDLAIVRAPQFGAPGVITADASSGQEVVAVDGATSGTRSGVIQRELQLRVDDVRAPTRSVRSGYEVGIELLPGDSGAGIFDANDRLVGVVFSGPADRDGRVFVVDHGEIEAVLAAPDSRWQCDPLQHRIIEQNAS